jgi:hypothetical protein
VSTHIPGPWRLDHDGILMSIVDQRQRVLADVFYGGRGEAFGGEVGEANGRLMASAPDLLTALLEISFLISRHGRHVREDTLKHIADAAIEKAQGG